MRPRACIASMSCSMVTAWSPRSPCRLSSSLKPELAEDGGCTGDGASSLPIHISPFVISISPILTTPFFPLWFSLTGLDGLLAGGSFGFWLIGGLFDVGDRGLPTLGVTWQKNHKITPTNFGFLDRKKIEIVNSQRSK